MAPAGNGAGPSLFSCQETDLQERFHATTATGKGPIYDLTHHLRGPGRGLRNKAFRRSATYVFVSA